MRLGPLLLLINLVALAGIGSPAAWADIMYSLTVNTSTVTGDSGYLDLQLAPGDATTQDATADVTAFSTDGTLVGAPSLNFGGASGASGALPGEVTIDNVPGNDYFQGFLFGTKLAFDVSLGGLAIESPNGTSDSGNTFALTFYGSDGSTPILTTNTVDGSAAEIFVNLNGTTTPVTYPATPGGASAVVIQPAVSPVPEPSSLLELGTMLAAITALGLTRSRRYPGNPGVSRKP